MLIDCFTVAAQTLNFLVLVWLLRRFLYKPILDAVDAREKRIAAQIADADAKMTEAQTERDEFQRKSAEFDGQRAALFSQATNDASIERQRLMDEARKAADAQAAARRETLKTDARSLNQAIRLRAQSEVFAITRKALSDLADASLEERLSNVFIRRLRAMDGPAKQRLGDALKTSSSPALIRSAFELPAEQRAAIQNALDETFAAKVSVRFETETSLVGGIELTTNGQKLSWSIEDYLGALESGVGELLDKPARPEPSHAMAATSALVLKG